VRRERRKKLSNAEFRAAGLTPGLVVRRIPAPEGSDNTPRRLDLQGENPAHWTRAKPKILPEVSPYRVSSLQSTRQWRGEGG